MKKFTFLFTIISILIFLFSGNTFTARAQTKMSRVMDTASLKNQLDYVQKRTKIYDNFRAIREDYFQKIKRNALDSLNRAKETITGLNKKIGDLEQQIRALQSDLDKTKQNLEEVTRTKNSLSLFGIRMNKAAYNVLLWGIIAGLAALLVILFLMYKRSHVVTVHTKKELEELKEEFENYRKSTRERIEKMTISHHKEIQKLKGNQGI